MIRPAQAVSLLLMLLLTGAALAQPTGGDPPSGADPECQEEYEEDMADAEEEDDPGQRAEDRREAEENYWECVEDSSNDPSDSDHRGSGTENDSSSGSDDMSEAERECTAEYREAQADAKEEYDEELAEAEDEEDRTEAKAEYDEELAEARREYQECLADARDDGDASVPAFYSGHHVSFAITPAGVSSYSVGGAPILASVAMDGHTGWDGFEARGASIELEGESAELKVSDTPTGVFRFESDDDTPIQVVFADGIAARPSDTDDHRGPGSHSIILQGDGFQARLFTEEGYHLGNGTLLAPSEFRLVVTSAAGLASKGEGTVNAIADGRIAVEIQVPRDGDARSAQHGDVNVSVESREGSLVAVVEGHGEGKIVLFNLEPGSYSGLDELEVLYDGVPIGLADSLEDVLDVSDGDAEYLIIVGAAETQLLVKVPHFSIHTIELTGASVGGSMEAVSTIALIVGAGVSAVFVAVTLMGRRRAR